VSSAPVDLPVLFRDEALLAVNKPSGIAVHRGLARERRTVASELRATLEVPLFPVHRLDRATSGVLLLALTAEAARVLQRQLEAGAVDKRYLALVRGIPPEEGRIDHPIPRDLGGPRVPAVTEYRRLAIWERYALVEARPLTGRIHQVRRHLKHIDHPLIGDVRYGKGEHNRLFRERFGLHRLALHALSIEFAHPFDGRRLRVAAPLPSELEVLLRALGVDPAAWYPSAP
jgi:tRNA pseudouridine65 synthase